MRCKRIRRLINTYLDNEDISSAQQEQIFDHTRSCATCHGYFERIEQLHTQIRSTPVARLPIDFHETLVARLRTEKESEEYRVGNGERLVATLRCALPVGRLRAEKQVSRPATRNLEPATCFRPPYFAFSVAAVMGVILLVFTLWHGNNAQPGPTIPVSTQALQIDVVSPFEDAVVEPSGFDVAAAFYTLDDVSKPALNVRVLLDEKDVTHVTEVSDDYVIYTPGTLAPGPHLATVQLLDASGMPTQQRSWAFYVLASSL